MIESRQHPLGDRTVDVVTLTVGPCRAVLTNLGARLVELHVPDRAGQTADVVLQRPTLSDMTADPNYMGSTAGRYANRIRAGRLMIDGRDVQLSTNEGANHLHGGHIGFDQHVWATELGADGDRVTFTRVSPDGEEGFPGNLATSVTYRLTDDTLHIDIEASTDAPTVANIVNHSYFNLGGHAAGTILDHLVEMRSSFYTPVDDELLPTGEILAVAGGPFDFRTATPIGKHLGEVAQSGAGRGGAGVGYDHNWVLAGTGMREVMTVTDPASGRRLTLRTNQPGVQFYVGGYMEGVTGKPDGDSDTPVSYPAFGGFTLETQTFPDAVNHSHFPPALLVPGQTYCNSIELVFTNT